MCDEKKVPEDSYGEPLPVAEGKADLATTVLDMKNNMVYYIELYTIRTMINAALLKAMMDNGFTREEAFLFVMQKGA